MPEVIVPLTAFMQSRCGKGEGITFVIIPYPELKVKLKKLATESNDTERVKLLLLLTILCFLDLEEGGYKIIQNNQKKGWLSF
ncbi:MAG: hypothetical protein GQ583_06355 [Methyloprofundus sp.]|nr:hypothetical protein [Methyloprofundus sp.]